MLRVGGETLVLTHDIMAEGTHFPAVADLADVGWKLVAVNLSDLAAKGAQPIGVILGQMMGADDDRFLEGLAEALEAFAVPLLGGDTVGATTGPRALGLTALGKASHSPVPGRNGAQPGDLLYITGPVGGAMMGFEALQTGSDADSLAFRRPQPLLAAGAALAPHVTAMMDVSDSVLLDAWRLATASGVTLCIASEDIPLAAPEARRAEALRWGDDYQLLFTLPSGASPPVPATRIGNFAAEDFAALWVDSEPLSPDDGLGYTHGA